MRLIDADALLRDNTWEWFDEWGNYTAAGQAVADAPTIGGWIPCSERLPKIEREGQRRGWYITTNEYGSVGETQYEFYDDLLKTGWQSSNQILAWMPFPEPYKRGEADD